MCLGPAALASPSLIVLALLSPAQAGAARHLGVLHAQPTLWGGIVAPLPGGEESRRTLLGAACGNRNSVVCARSERICGPACRVFPDRPITPLHTSESRAKSTPCSCACVLTHAVSPPVLRRPLEVPPHRQLTSLALQRHRATASTLPRSPRTSRANAPLIPGPCARHCTCSPLARAHGTSHAHCTRPHTAQGNAGEPHPPTPLRGYPNLLS